MLAQKRLEIRDCVSQTLVQFDCWAPTEQLFGKGDIGLALSWIVFGQGPRDDLRFRAGDREDLFRQFANREFIGVTDVERSGDLFRRIHEAVQSVDQIGHVAEGSRLQALAEDGDVFSKQGLADEVRHYAAIVGAHIGAIGIENSRDLDAQSMLTAIVEKQSFGTPLALVVAGSAADRIDIAPIVLGLRMDGGIAIDLGCGGLQDADLEALSEAEHVDRAGDARLRRLNGVELIMDRRGRTSEVINLVNFDKQREGYVVAEKLETPVVEEILDVAAGSGGEIIGAKNLVALVKQKAAKMGSEKARAAGDQTPLLFQ